MDREKIKTILNELIGGQLGAMVAADDSPLRKVIDSAIANAVSELQETLATTPTLGQPSGTTSDQMVREMLPMSRSMGGQMIATPQGSILDLSRKHAPWIRCSEEVAAWARDFSQLLASKGTKVGKTLQESTDPQGGYLVPEEFRATLLMYDAEPAVVWPRATIWPMTTDKLGMPKLAQRPDGIAGDDYDHHAGVIFTWTEEGGTKTETEPTFEFIELIAHELSGYTALTNILISDSVINIMNFLTALFRSAWIWQTDKEFIRGDGANKPLGIVSDPLVLTVNRQTAGTVTFTDVNAMRTMLPSVFDAGAVWLLNKQVEGALRNERDTGNALLLQEFYSNLADGYVPQMLGYPVIRADGKTYPMGTKGDVILANLRYYYVGDRQNFTMDSSTHYLFRSNKTAVRVSGRLDGQCSIPEAFVVLDDVATAS